MYLKSVTNISVCLFLCSFFQLFFLICIYYVDEADEKLYIYIFLNWLWDLRIYLHQIQKVPDYMKKNQLNIWDNIQQFEYICPFIKLNCW